MWTLDDGADRRMSARAGRETFLRFALDHDLECGGLVDRTVPCVLVHRDCGSTPRGLQSLPDDLFAPFEVPRIESMDGCWEFSATQWRAGRVTAIDYYFDPYY